MGNPGNLLELPAGECDLILENPLLVTEVDNDRGDRPRWAQIQLWSYDTPAGRQYLIYTIGHSVIYHVHGPRGCGNGIPVTAAEFPTLGTPAAPIPAEPAADLDPCEDCQPPPWQDAPPSTLFNVEYTWYRHRKCADGDEVIDGLRRDPKCRNCWHRHKTGRPCWCRCDQYEESPRTLSIPGRQLVEQARRADPEIARAARRKLRL